MIHSSGTSEGSPDTRILPDVGKVEPVSFLISVYYILDSPSPDKCRDEEYAWNGHHQLRMWGCASLLRPAGMCQPLRAECRVVRTSPVSGAGKEALVHPSLGNQFCLLGMVTCLSLSAKFPSVKWE